MSALSGLVTNSFALARFTADGALDQDFGRAGQVTTDFAGRHDTAYGLALDGNRIVLAGETFGKRRTRFALARYLDDGSIDFSFGTRGRVATRFARRYAGARDVTVTASGRIVPVGGAGGLFALARYLP